jgi:hypothetical protein
MALKAWIDDIKTAAGGGKSEAQIERAGAPETGIPIIRCGDYPLPGESEADKILFAARDEIVKGGVFHFTAETQAAETEVNKSYKAILKGGSDFKALCEACAQWVKAARTKPAAPGTVDLFPGKLN